MPNYHEAVFSVILIVIVCVKTSEGVPPQPTGRPSVTNNDIRDAILQLVNVIRTTEDKLERHEYRDRSLGEQLKRGLVSIDKRVKQWDHFKGAITRLDERLAAVETILIQKEERERSQSQKTFDVVDDIQKTLPMLMDELKKDLLEELLKQKPAPAPVIAKPEISKQDFESLKKDIMKRVNGIDESIGKIEKELKIVSVDTNTSRELNEKTNTGLSKLDKLLQDEEGLLRKYGDKLGEYKEIMKESPAQLKEQADWQTNFLKSLKEHKQRIEDVLSSVHNISNKINALPGNDTIEQLNVNTNNIAEKIIKNTDSKTKEAVDEIDNKISEMKMNIAQEHNEILNSIVGLSNDTGVIESKLNKSYSEIKSDLQAIKKVDEVMVQTADNVLDTKRRLEYGIHQIMAELGQLMKTATKDLANTISDRFDVFELSVLDEENGALANLTHKIGDEIDQVWRQIGIMHQKMNSNADILTKLQNQTDTYVNGSVTVMDNMKGKVAKITSKIVELDENLNFLMGKLMLVSHEFNQIKSGLSKALDEIKSTFHTVQDKIKDSGPGPHVIESDENTDVSPVRRKRSVN